MTLLTMSLRNDIVSFWFWGYILSDIWTELQAPVIQLGQIKTKIHVFKVTGPYLNLWQEFQILPPFFQI